MFIGFSTLSGREDLFSFAKELKEEGATTILAGPQAHSDFIGEVGWKDHAHRFHGLSDYFSFALHGPAEQAIGFLDLLERDEWRNTAGLLFFNKESQLIKADQKPWNEEYLGSIRWDNLYRLGVEGFHALDISTAQVLQQIGCPHAG